MPDKLTDNLSNNSPILSNGLTDSEIFEKLEKYKDVSDSDITTTSVETILLKATYLFINRLQERVKKCEKVEYFADKTIAILQTENEMLKSELNELVTEYQKLDDTVTKAYKEFAERLKAVYADFDEKNEQIPYPSLLAAIDCLLIGMVGEGDGSL